MGTDWAVTSAFLGFDFVSRKSLPRSEDERTYCARRQCVGIKRYGNESVVLIEDVTLANQYVGSSMPQKFIKFEATKVH